MLSGILLAAGESRRMGCLKGLLPLPGSASGEKHTFISFILKNLYPVCNEVILVLGYEAHLIKKKLSGLTSNVRIVINREYKRGQLSSLRAGIKETSPDCTGILSALVDHPLVEKETYRLLRLKFAEAEDKIIVPTYKGRRGHPVIFSSRFFPDLINAPLDRGAKYECAEQSSRCPVGDLLKDGDK